MRRLLLRLTAIASVLAAALAGGIGLASGISLPIALFRAALAFGIVALAGAGVGLVLMRTALRRYYEQGRATSGDRRVRADH